MKVGSVVIDCNGFTAMYEFWRDALGYKTGRLEPDDWVILTAPEEHGVAVCLQKVPEPRSGKNRLHVDLWTDDQQGEVERLLELGATRFARTPEPGEDFVVLQDPEGNLFCVIDLNA